MANPRALQVAISVGTGDHATFIHAVPPNQFLSLTHTRYAGEAGNQLKATFIDHTAFDLETKLLFLGNAVQDRAIHYQYGYSYSLGSMSRLYAGFIYDYSPTIVANIINLEIMAVSQESSTMTNTGAKVYNDDTRSVRISDVIKQIANEFNWKLGEIEQTTLIVKDMINSYQSPMEFINNELVPYAISALTGNGFYSVYFTTDMRGNNVVNFKSMIPGRMATGSYTYMGNSKTYSYNTRLSTVLSWTPVSAGSYLLWGGGNTETNTMSTSTGDLFNASSGTLVNAAGGSNKTWLSKNNYSQLFISSANKEIADSAVAAVYSKAKGMQYNASCTIIGDPLRSVGETLEFNIILKNRVHYSSGRYMVLGVEDQIGTSGFTTNLSLVKNAAYVGDLDYSLGTTPQSTGAMVTSPATTPGASSGDGFGGGGGGHW